MAIIQILDDTLASQVAAGEVVERPSSVVKELVENSLDAGARAITVEFQRGGTALIRVTDDGCGMSRDDALLSLERHATSKIKKSSDLSTILTLGFRGEAVPSIASVARFRMTTREKGGDVGTEIIVDGGNVIDVRDAGVPEGTCIEAKQLFYNIPARRKFLRAETTEAAHIEHQVRLHALAAPEVRFSLKKDGRVVFDLPGTRDWRVRISGLAGSATANQLIEVKKHASPGMIVRGYLLPSEYARKGRRQQYVFLNGRPIEDPAISRALRDGYKGAIQDGTHPAAWLWIEMDPELVDVNVHPAKREVRFHRPHEIRNLIAEAVELALSPRDTVSPIQQTTASSSQPSPHLPEFSAEKEVSSVVGQDTRKSPPETLNTEGSPTESAKSPELSGVPSTAQPVSSNDSICSNGLSRSEKEGTNEGGLNFPHRVERQEEMVDEQGGALVQQPEFSVIGALHDRYILLEGEEGLVLLDPVAARERVVYENVLKGEQEGGVRSQGLLIPELLELDSIDADLVLRHAHHFSDAGMKVESFGGTTVKVSSIPAFLELGDISGFLHELVYELHETVGTRRGKSMAYDVFASSFAKRVARHETCRVEHAEKLLSEMFLCELPYCTPGGRPTLIHISLSELDRKFGR